MLFKIAYFALNIICFIIFVVNFIISLVRDLNVKKQLKTNPKEIKARVREVQQGKNRIYMLVEFSSPHNRLLFSETYELFESDLKGREFKVGDEIDLIYNDISSWKKIWAFPLHIKELKVKLEGGPLFANIALILLSIYVCWNMITTYVNKNAFTSDIALTEMFTTFYIFVMIFVYGMVLTYVVTGLIDMPRKDLQNYLKLYGNIAKARVKTYKFSNQKNAKGTKESIIDIEFSTNDGTQVETRLTSFLYTETQEEYIDIIYDPKKPKNVVYLRQ